MRRAARAAGKNQFWPAQPRAVPAKYGYVTGGYPRLTPNFKPIFSYDFHHADFTLIECWSKWNLFCLPRRVCAWSKSVLASPAQGHSSQIWGCHRVYPSLTQNFKRNFFYVWHHADSRKIDCRSKWIFFAPCAAPRAPGQNQFWPAEPRAVPAKYGYVTGGYPRLTPNFKPIFSYIFCHADSTQINSRSKWNLFCAPCGACAWATSVVASTAERHPSQIWVCHRGVT